MILRLKRFIQARNGRMQAKWAGVGMTGLVQDWRILRDQMEILDPQHQMWQQHRAVQEILAQTAGQLKRDLDINYERESTQ